MQTSARPMTKLEREALESMFDSLPGGARRGSVILLNWSLNWLGTMVLFVLGWLLAAKLLRSFSDLEIGWADRTIATAILTGGALVCAALATLYSARWARGWTDRRGALRQDLAAGRVSVEDYRFTAAFVLQEPEHGGLVYLLRTDDDGVFVHYDTGSQRTGDEGENSRSDSLVPREHLRIIRAPGSGLVIESEFSGDTLDAGAPRPLRAPPGEWPEDMALCDVPWDIVLSRFAARRAAGA